MPKDLVADVEPLDVTGTRSVAVGTIAWAVAFLALLPFTAGLRDDGNGDWLWTCLAGVVLGIVGWWYCDRRARRLRAAPAADRETDPGAGER